MGLQEDFDAAVDSIRLVILIYLSNIYLSIYLSIYQSINQSIFLSIIYGVELECEG